MRRLYVQIYLALVASLALFVVLASVVWLAVGPGDDERRLLEGLGGLLAERLPPPGASPEEYEEALGRLAARLPMDLAVFDAGGERLGGVGAALEPPPPEARRGGWRRGGREGGPSFFLRLPDGRALVARPLRGAGRHAGRLLLVLGLLAAAIAVGAYPVVRRLTSRLERLQRRVDRLAEGELSARVAVEGRDEIASLARSFNRAAERIERLVDAQRTMLAGASHELRTPLARIRIAAELLGEGRPELRDRIARDVAELDELIEELLLASRLDATTEPFRSELVDLRGLVDEEAARVGARVDGERAEVAGDARLLRWLVRNLLDNARRHGGGAPIAVRVARDGGEVVVEVADEGPGVPAGERERIFEPFYRSAGAASAEPGVGLGLALVRAIARRHGGEARCVGREEGGSVFEVRLPGTDEP